MIGLQLATNLQSNFLPRTHEARISFANVWSGLKEMTFRNGIRGEVAIYGG